MNAFRPTAPLSVGPYKIDPATVTESQLTFVRNPGGYAADRVNFDKVVVYQGETEPGLAARASRRRRLRDARLHRSPSTRR